MTQARRPSPWVAHRERGSWLLLRAMAFVSVHCGRTLSRSIVYAIALYFFLFGPTARRSARRYLRLALGREPKATDRFRLILSFATTIHDRVYLIGNRFDLFNISVDGEELLSPYAHGGSGVLLLGAHLGSFEVIHSMARRHGFKVAMAMYEENARKISTILAAINPKPKPILSRWATSTPCRIFRTGSIMVSAWACWAIARWATKKCGR